MNSTKETHTIDATGKTLGRLSSEIAVLLMGKHKPSFQRHIDSGDYVVIQNVAKIILTGKKAEQKIYYKHSLHPGHLKETQAKELLEKKPELLLKNCVLSMLPDNKLRNERIKRLTIS